MALTLCAVGPAAAQHGVILSGGGPIQRSMGGTATANPLDSLGALFWNPATLSALPQNEMSFSSEFLWARPEVSSTVDNLTGTTKSDTGTLVFPDFGLVQHLDDSVTLGLGAIVAAGFSANYPASLNNPVLLPPPFGIGQAYAELQVFQLVPAASLQVTDRLSVGISPIVNMASFRTDPLILAPPDDANGDGLFSYRDGTHTRWTWGAGLQIGMYYASENCWGFGFSVKSPQWFDTFRFQTVDELGRPRSDNARFDLPAIASLGVSYWGVENWTFAGDVRYIDYRNAEGFDDVGFLPNGAVTGLGWDSQIVLAAGAQYQVSEQFSARFGYSYNNNPQDSTVAFVNLAAPTIIEHTAYTGASWSLTDMLTLSLAYVHGFESSLQGPIVTPGGVLPGTSVRSRVSADAVVMGFAVKY